MWGFDPKNEVLCFLLPMHSFIISHQNKTPISYQKTPISYQKTPISYQKTPISHQKTPISHQKPIKNPIFPHQNRC
jgi:hypothetical protein